MTVVAVLDYGFGNVRSAMRALERAGAQVELTSDRLTCANADGLVVPGVGAFAACMAGLKAVGAPAMIERRLAGGRPILGICVGMQVMFASGQEERQTSGLGQWPGVVEPVQAAVVPHMGWNTVAADADSVLLAGLDGQRFYFVHSYAVRDLPPLGFGRRTPLRVSWTHYGHRFVAAVENGPLSATQFHPEKSGDAGMTLLENWIGSL